MKRFRRISTFAVLFVGCVAFLGCNSNSDLQYENIYDDVGELDIELRDHLATRAKTNRTGDVKRFDEVGEMSIDEIRPKRIVRSRTGAIRRPLRSVPAPAPVAFDAKQDRNLHAHFVGEMEIGY